jgi:apolipoprotein N-acyltransferase
MHTRVCTCIHGYVHAYMGMSMYTWVCTCIQGYVHAYMGMYMHTWVCPCIHGYVHAYMGMYIRVNMYLQKSLRLSGVEQSPSHSPQEQETRVRIPPRYGENYSGRHSNAVVWSSTAFPSAKRNTNYL